MSLFISPVDPNLKEAIENLRPTPGYCLFIDIAGSTELKDLELPKWIIYTYNTFANIQTYLFSKFEPIKVLGDGLLFFIPETEMQEETPLTLYNGLTNIVSEEGPYFKEVKIGAAFCRNAYDITFVRGNRDIYGKDIDLTARLAGEAASREIVMNKEFVEKIRSAWTGTFNKSNLEEVERINGPELIPIRGFTNRVEVFRFRA